MQYKKNLNNHRYPVVRQNKTTVWILTILRIIVGWHFLYEGIVKLFNPNWSSASYLMESKWLLSGFFHWLISTNTTLSIVDFINTWGLLLIGFCLFIGLFIRVTSISGALLLIFYYIASPPFVYSSIPVISHFYIINYNLIEAVALIVLASFPRDYTWGINRLFLFYHYRRKDRNDVTDNELMKVAEVACAKGETIHNESVPIMPEMVFSTLKAIDMIGKNRKGHF